MNRKEIVQILATKYNLPLERVNAVTSHQFKFVAKTMAEGNFDAVRLPYFGKFHAKPERIKRINDAARAGRG